jgi:hypothetical protein
VTRIDVVATVASVGPYVFQTSAAGNRSRSWDATSGASVSPQNRNRSSRGSMPWLNVGSTRHICANDGVDTHAVNREAASS